MKIKVIKKSDNKVASPEAVREAIFDKEAERQATNTIKTWIYANQAAKRDEELRCREFWKLH